MSSFLHLLAKDLLRKQGSHFDRMTVIFPNKRAGLFLARELSTLIGQAVWMPEIITLNEFIQRHTGLRQAEELTLIIKLYQAFRETSGTSEKFDDFYFWGNMLLGDFDDLDKYLVDAKDLFANLVALKDIEDSFPYLSPEQLTLIKSFWSSFRQEAHSREQLAFLNTWDRLYPTYCRFREKLSGEGLCYEGMGQRIYCERLSEITVDAPIVFAGFNALNLCEKKIFSHFRDLGKALFYWDYDLYYTANEQHEAGYYIRENLRFFPNELGPEHFNSFRHNGKKIEYISLSNPIGQAKLLPTLLRETESDRQVDEGDTAVVLCDEKLLPPVLYSIPDEIKKINITMGYPAQHTAIASLISLLGDLHHYAKKEKERVYYYYKPVVALLSHSLIRETAAEKITDTILHIREHNLVYIAEEKLHFNEITRMIFHTEGEMMPYLLDILGKLLQLIVPDNEDAAREKEVLFTLYTRIQQIRNHFEEEGIFPENKLYIKMIAKIIQGLSIPFSGEPLEGMQVMGLMETRMLDFKRLIILSANEGIIPKGGQAASFIPYNLRKGFGLPTPEHRDALFAYYFYRLLQRAEEIKLLYTDTTQGLYSGEMSRFLYQIKYESGLPVRIRHFQNHISTQSSPPISIEKDDTILKQLERYTRKEERGLSPSALNTYLECRLRFYFRYVAGLREQEDLAEELDHRLLGNIFHEAVQTLYGTLPREQVNREALDRLLANEVLISKHIRSAYLKVYDTSVSGILDSGANELVLAVVRKYVRRVLEYDRGKTPFELIAMEKNYRMYFPVETPEGKRSVYIEGNIDRVDRTEEGTRVIDYKTGADKTDFKTISSVFDRHNKQRNKAAFQTLLYCLMYASERQESNPLLPGIYSTKMLFSPLFDEHLRCDGITVCDFLPYEPEFRDNLNALLEELFSSHTPFDQTAHSEKCRNCPYAGICNRG